MEGGRGVAFSTRKCVAGGGALSSRNVGGWKEFESKTRVGCEAYVCTYVCREAQRSQRFPSLNSMALSARCTNPKQRRRRRRGWWPCRQHGWQWRERWRRGPRPERFRDIPHGTVCSRRLARATAATCLGVCANLGTMLLIVRPAAVFFQLLYWSSC